MKRFFYKAIKDHKDLVSGYIEAESNRDAADKIRALGFLPSSIYEEMSHVKQLSQHSNDLRKLSLNDMIAFTEDLYTYSESGIPILSALDNICTHSSSKRISEFAQHLSKGIKSGQTLSQALEDYREVVGETYVVLCKAGEESGSLPATLRYLKTLLLKQRELKNKLISVSIYPAILILAMVGMFFLLGGFVFPRMISFIGLEAEIPKTAYFFTSGYKLITTYWWLILLVIVYLVFGWKNVLDRRNLSSKLQNFLIKIPVIKDCITYIELSHYMTVMNIAYDAGIPITDSLRLAGNTLQNKDLSKRAQLVTALVEKGTPLSSAYYESDLIPSTLMPLITTGEETGKLGQMFRDISIAMTNKLDAAISVAAKLFEPALLAIIGVFVAIAAVTIIKIYFSGLSTFF